MPTLLRSVPKYRKHRASGQAIVSIGGRDFYLGPWGTKASRVEYDRLITEWLANDRQPIIGPNEAPSLTVAEVVARYWAFARKYYRKGGRETSSVDSIRRALKPVRALYGQTLAHDFGPRALKAVRHKMVVAGWSRGTVNKRIAIIKRMVKWAVGEELIPPSIYHGLQAVGGLHKGRTEAPEPEAVKPVPEALVQATLPELPEVVADMVRFQRLTGCRPAEVCMVRPCDVDRSGQVWEYRPESHKTEHHGRERVILVGPKAQSVLAPYLLRPSEAYCFSPTDTVRKKLVMRHANRKTPLNQGNRPGTNRKRKPLRSAGDCYTRDSYRRAIHKTIDKINRQRKKEALTAGTKKPELMEKWCPNRLRHSTATEIRKKFGLEAAQVVLGHAAADVTQVYAERDLELARRVIGEVG